MAKPTRIVTQLVLVLLFIASLFPGHSFHFENLSTSQGEVSALAVGHHTTPDHKDCTESNGSPGTCDHANVPTCTSGFCCFSIPESFVEQDNCGVIFATIMIFETDSPIGRLDPPPPRSS